MSTNTQYNVYFAQALDKVKIGCSRRPKERILQVSEWVPFPVKMLATMAGAYPLEAALHRMFAEEWSHGEWFTLSPRLYDFIDRVAHGLPVEIVFSDLSEQTDARRRAIADKKRISRRLHQLPRELAVRVNAVSKGAAIPADLLAEVHSAIASMPPLPVRKRPTQTAA